jgi:hypothetical protein
VNNKLEITVKQASWPNLKYYPDIFLEQTELHATFLHVLIFNLEDGGDSRLTFNGLHGLIYQKMELFITTAVRTSNPTCFTGDLQDVKSSNNI